MPQKQSAPAPSLAPLRVFVPPGEQESGAAGLSPSMTLKQFFTAFFRPVCLISTGKAERNVDQYDESLDYWVDFTGDPPLEAIDDYTTARIFGPRAGGARAPQGAPIADNTVRKHCVHLQCVLDRCGPRTRENRQGQSLLDEVPYLPKPQLIIKDVEDNFSLDELAAILAHCHVPIAPHGLSGAELRTWWQSLFIFDYNVGLRIGSLMDLTWPMVKPDRIELPRVKGGQPKRFPLNRFALSALQGMRGISGPVVPHEGPHVWPWPHSRDYSSLEGPAAADPGRRPDPGRPALWFPRPAQGHVHRAGRDQSGRGHDGGRPQQFGHDAKALPQSVGAQKRIGQIAAARRPAAQIVLMAAAAAWALHAAACASAGEPFAQKDPPARLLILRTPAPRGNLPLLAAGPGRGGLSPRGSAGCRWAFRRHGRRAARLQGCTHRLAARAVGPAPPGFFPARAATHAAAQPVRPRRNERRDSPVEPSTT